VLKNTEIRRRDACDRAGPGYQLEIMKKRKLVGRESTEFCNGGEGYRNDFEARLDTGPLRRDKNGELRGWQSEDHIDGEKNLGRGDQGRAEKAKERGFDLGRWSMTDQESRSTRNPSREKGQQRTCRYADTELEGGWTKWREEKAGARDPVEGSEGCSRMSVKKIRIFYSHGPGGGAQGEPASGRKKRGC